MNGAGEEVVDVGAGNPAPIRELATAVLREMENRRSSNLGGLFKSNNGREDVGNGRQTARARPFATMEDEFRSVFTPTGGRVP